MEPASTSAAPLTEEERSYYRFNQKAWSISAPHYELVTRPIRRLRGHVVELARTDPPMRDLDVATGTGDQAFAFAENAAEVVGLDLSEAMITIARRKNQHANVSLLQGDAAALPWPERELRCRVHLVRSPRDATKCSRTIGE